MHVQFILGQDQNFLGRDFVRKFGVTVKLNNGLIRIGNPDRKYVKRPVNRMFLDEKKIPIFFRDKHKNTAKVGSGSGLNPA